LGIGTKTPTHTIQVIGQVRATSMANATGTANLPSYRFHNDGNTGMFSDANDQLAFSTGGIEVLRMDTNQSVGIKTSTPTATLDVNGSFRLKGTFADKDGDVGNIGQILSSTSIGTDWIDPPLPMVLVKTGDYTLSSSDNGSILTFNDTNLMTLTVPLGLAVGYNVSLYQIGIGQVTIVGSGGVSIKNRLSRFKTAGKDAGIGLVSTATNIFHLTGDLKK